MNPLFQIRADASVEVINGKADLLDNFEVIGGLVAQNESNIQQFDQICEFLDVSGIGRVGK